MTPELLNPHAAGKPAAQWHAENEARAKRIAAEVEASITARRGPTHKSGTPCVVHGVLYRSFGAAAQARRMSVQAVISRCAANVEGFARVGEAKPRAKRSPG